MSFLLAEAARVCGISDPQFLMLCSEVLSPHLVHMKEALSSQALALMGKLNHPDVCWKDHTGRHKQSSWFRHSIDDNLLT